MASRFLWPVLLTILSTTVSSVRAECDPSHAVVAIASILSTLAVVAIVLVGVYFFMRRRRKAHRLQQGWETANVRNKGHINNGFTEDDVFVIVEEGTSPGKRKGQANTKEPVSLARENKTWSSLPRTDKTGRLYREGSCGSLDENIAAQDPEIISVTLESQDIIGLGFNISGSYSDGIRVSEVHNRGPAKEGGEIKVGDRILSVTVSYENIVYEDALTILSYASPYPVKIVLEKATDGKFRNFVDKKQKGSTTRRLTHPLYRSHSMDTLKSPDGNASRSHPKRAHSEVKIETGKRFLKWRNKNSKKNQEYPGKENAVPPKLSKSGNDKGSSDPNRITVDTEVYPQVASEVMERVQFSKQENLCSVDMDNIKYPESLTQDMSVEDDPDQYIYQKTPPDKPERKNRRKSDSQSVLPSSSGFDEIIVPVNTAFTFSAPPSAENDGETEADEEIIVPDHVKRGSADEAEGEAEEDNEPQGNEKDISGAIELLKQTEFIDFIMPRRPQSPEMDPVEEEAIIASDRSERLVLSAAPPTDESSTDNTDSARETMKSPLLDEEALERIIAMNAFAPGTQGWAGVQAGGPLGGTVDDFVPDHPIFTTQPVLKPNNQLSPTDGFKSDTNAGSLNNNRSLAYEIRDDYVTGKPFAVEINKNKNMVRTGSMDPQTMQLSANDGNSPVTLRPSSSFDVSQSKGIPALDGSDVRDTLEWSGQRLVRSDSFTNIFLSD